MSWVREIRSGASWLFSGTWPVRALTHLRSAGPAAALLSVSLLGTLFVGFATDQSHRAREARLAVANSELRKELVHMRDRTARLEAALADAGGSGSRLSARTSSLFARPADDFSAAARIPTSSDIDTLVQQARSLAFNWGEAAASLQLRYDELTATPSILPAAGFLTSAFSKSRWHPILDRARPHQGIDISAPMGTPVLAAANGRVQRVGYFGQYGLMIEISHGNGYLTRYAHLKRAHIVRGQRVERARRIGEVGETGLAIGPHLHYEVLLNGVAKNPLGYILDGAIPE